MLERLEGDFSRSRDKRVVEDRPEQRVVNADKCLHGSGGQGDLVAGNAGPAVFLPQGNKSLLHPVCLGQVGQCHRA